MIIIAIIFIVSVFAMFLLHDYVRRNRRLYRFGYAFIAATGVASSILLSFSENGDLTGPKRIIFISFVLIVGIPIFLYNMMFLIKGEGQILTSTLENCTVTTITGGKIHQRVSYRVDGTSVEGNKDSFLLQYPPDKKAVTQEPVTDKTVIVVEYYSNSYSIYRVSRKTKE